MWFKSPHGAVICPQCKKEELHIFFFERTIVKGIIADFNTLGNISSMKVVSEGSHFPMVSKVRIACYCGFKCSLIPERYNEWTGELHFKPENLRELLSLFDFSSPKEEEEKSQDNSLDIEDYSDLCRGTGHRTYPWYTNPPLKEKPDVDLQIVLKRRRTD